MNDYEVVARVIRYLDQRHIEQPDLATLAGYVGLSQGHLHRLFSTWAGITPKDFLQSLTFSHAKEMLQKGNSVLDAALNSGLSGPGRLHDLCVNLEAASPGELKSGGEGWAIIAGFADSPFGRCLIGRSPRGVCYLSFVESADGCAEWVALQKEWPKARLDRDDLAAGKIAHQIFERSAHSKTVLRAYVRGTEFQVRVWRALLRVRPGTLVSYGQLAAAVDNPAAARAVGSAVGRNPLAFLIPCHRVIRETGAIGNYRSGSVRKRAILAWENSIILKAVGTENTGKSRMNTDETNLDA